MAPWHFWSVMLPSGMEVAGLSSRKVMKLAYDQVLRKLLVDLEKKGVSKGHINVDKDMYWSL